MLEMNFVLFTLNVVSHVIRLTHLAKFLLSDTSVDLKAGVKHDVDLEAR